jgi:hypothetical protein
MAVAVVLEFTGATLDQYDQVIERMGLTPRGSGPPGALFHWVTKTDDGIRVTDVWESQEIFDRFNEEQIQPQTQAVGVPEPSSVTFYDVPPAELAPART